MELIVDLQSVTRLYGTVIGVNDVTLSLRPGAYGLLGPNGAGKTTLLNLLTGQLSPTLGSVRVLDANPCRNATFAAQIGYLPGNEGMYANVSAYDWVTYLTRLHGYGRGEAKQRAEAALEQVGMSEHMHRDIAQYSRGMRQRTRLAQAIAHEPRLLILDEPFNGLDPIARHDMGHFLRQWSRDGRSLILASHVLHEIESITRSFLLLCGGRLLASGSADDIHELLADVPSEIRLKTDRPAQLASQLISLELADAIRVEEEILIATTRTAIRLYEHLAGLATDGGPVIRELRSADDSLQEVFDSLMRIHRGEL